MTGVFYVLLNIYGPEHSLENDSSFFGQKKISVWLVLLFLFGFQHHEQVEKYSTTLETLLFTQDLDPNILDVFQQFLALRM